MATYHIEHRHSYQNCYGSPDFNEEKMDLWRQVKVNAEENNVEIKFFKMNPSQHVSFMLLEAPDYESLEKTIGQCKKTGQFTITPVVEQFFF